MKNFQTHEKNVYQFGKILCHLITKKVLSLFKVKIYEHMLEISRQGAKFLVFRKLSKHSETSAGEGGRYSSFGNI